MVILNLGITVHRSNKVSWLTYQSITSVFKYVAEYRSYIMFVIIHQQTNY